VNWFLNDKADVRSSYYLEDVASEFAVQGLELDWAGVCWDGDFHHLGGHWISQAFKGTKWQSVRDESKRFYFKNAYRVILTRARQGMVLFVPRGDSFDLNVLCFLRWYLRISALVWNSGLLGIKAAAPSAADMPNTL
jgi:hypothetical protein